MKRSTTLLSLVAILFFAGCSFKPDLQVPKTELPIAEEKSLHVETYWWKKFGDEKLNLLVQDALKENLSLQAAKQRVLQSYALLQNKNAGDFPTLGLSGSATQQDELKGVESKKELSISF